MNCIPAHHGPFMGTIISINVARPGTVTWRGKEVDTGIFKEPVTGPVSVGRLGLAGDRQADLSVHGGPRKAVYIYPAEHYAFWRDEFHDRELPPGMFGENLTTRGILETDVREGDQLQIGSVLFEVTQPRFPCFKLAAKFGFPGMVRRFAEAGRPGVYLAVIETGTIETGQAIELTRRQGDGPSIADVFRRKFDQ
jgi:MOSC domain-containing protein YiiM